MNRRKWFKTLLGAAVATAAGVTAEATKKIPKLPDSVYYRGSKFKVHFCKITTPEFTKNVDKLTCHRVDMRTVITNEKI